MKKYNVLLRSTTGTDTTEIIEAANANDARWEGRKKQNIHEAVVLGRVKETPGHLSMIGNSIKRLRIEKGLSQEQLADAAGLRVATISDIENGKANVQVNTLVKISSALNCYMDVSFATI